MKILFILENYYPNIGGVETLFKSLAKELVTQNHEVTILTNKFDRSLQNEERIDGSQIIRLPFGNRYLFTFFAWWKAYKIAKKHEIIHTTSYNAGIPAIIAGKLARKKVIITFHEVWGKLWFDLPFMSKPVLFLFFFFEWFLLKLPFNHFIAVSKHTQKSLIKAGINSEKITAIYNGIDYGEFSDIKEVPKRKTFTFCFFGRLGISKGLDILLEGTRVAKNKGLSFKLILIVPTQPKSLLSKIKKTIQSSNISDVIEIKHELPFTKLIQTVASSNAVIVPSYSEGFGYSAVESIALGIPIISSDKGSLSEVISGNYLKMKTHDAEGLLECMEAAINNEWQYKEIKKFEISETVKAYSKLYEKYANTIK